MARADKPVHWASSRCEDEAEERLDLGAFIEAETVVAVSLDPFQEFGWDLLYITEHFDEDLVCTTQSTIIPPAPVSHPNL